MTSAPLVWLLLGDKHGDNAQVTALAKELGWPSVAKNRATPLPAKQPLPWPDIVIGIGHRSVPLALEIKKRSGNKAILVQLGRPRAALGKFDLIVSTPQYGLPDNENLMKITLPLTYHDAGELKNAIEVWQERLIQYPRPWIAVLVGAGTTQLRFGEAEAKELAAKAEVLRSETGGTLFVTTSPRTPPKIANTIVENLSAVNFVWQWAAGKPNPYLAYLALADAFVVTTDSVSMMADAVGRMKPLYIFDLPLVREATPSFRQRLGAYLKKRHEQRRLGDKAGGVLDFLFDCMTRRGLLRPSRNVKLFVSKLYDIGIAQPLGQPAPPHKYSAGQHSLIDLERKAVAERIQALYRGRKAVD